MADRGVLYFKSTYVDNGHLVWKAWLHDRGSDRPWLGWELRRVLSNVDERFEKGCGAWLRRYNDRVEKYLECVGFDIESAIIPSMASFRAKGEPAPPSVVAEYQIKSEGMIALIVGMLTSRRSVDHRDKAFKALRSLMFSLIPDQAIPALQALGVHIVPAGIDEPCNAMLQGDDVCCHMRGLLDTHNEETDFRSTYLDILVYMFGEERGCNVISAMLQAHLGKLMRLLLTRMMDVAVDDPLKLDWDDLMLQNHREKRRRVDADVQHAVMHTAIQNGIARTPGGLARSQQSLSASTVKGWVPKHMGLYRGALSLHFSNCQSASVCFDAARFGEPKEDVVVYGISNNVTGYGGWLAPQASHFSHHHQRLWLCRRWCCCLCSC